jgi:hypothetical protein
LRARAPLDGGTRAYTRALLLADGLSSFTTHNKNALLLCRLGRHHFAACIDFVTRCLKKEMIWEAIDILVLQIKESKSAHPWKYFGLTTYK